MGKRNFGWNRQQQKERERTEKGTISAKDRKFYKWTTFMFSWKILVLRYWISDTKLYATAELRKFNERTTIFHYSFHFSWLQRTRLFKTNTIHESNKIKFSARSKQEKIIRLIHWAPGTYSTDNLFRDFFFQTKAKGNGNGWISVTHTVHGTHWKCVMHKQFQTPWNT